MNTTVFHNRILSRIRQTKYASSYILYHEKCFSSTTLVRSRNDLKHKEDALLSLIKSHSDSTRDKTINNETALQNSPSKEKKLERDILKRKDELWEEANSITKSLFRTCIRSTKVIRPGNDEDEASFKKREENQKNSFSVGSSSQGSFSFEPPVDRENELFSRYSYYLEWARESFHQESDCLASDSWREEDVGRYVHFVRQGEDKRKWVLNDYKFDDPYVNVFENDRLDVFEKNATQLVKDIYSQKGWKLSSEIKEAYNNDEHLDDEFWNDEDGTDLK